MSVILITGAGKGIGLATALHFARNGHNVFAGVRNADNADELTQTIAMEGLPITLVPINVDDDESVLLGVESVLAQAQHIDVLVNNAGIGVMGSLEETSIDVAQALFQTNYFGPIRMMRAVLPGMRERRSGTIVNISSFFGRLVWAGHVHYPASKYALEAASEALAQEVAAFDIRVAIVEPGRILTPMMKAGRARRRANPPPTGPYGNHVRRFGMFMDAGFDRPTLPQAVADTIEHAITTDEPQLRYVVGEDAQALLDGRHQLTDEEWTEIGNSATDDEYCERMLNVCGVDLFR